MSAKRDGAYWDKRKVDLYAQVERDEGKLARKLSKYYQAEAAKLAKDIAAYYQRFGDKNVLEYRKMLVSLGESDRRLLFEQMDEFARRYPQWRHLMPVRESIYKLNEMEGLRESMRLQQLRIGAREHELIEPLLEGDALKSANLIAEQMGFGMNFYTVNAEVVRLTVGAKWADGADFSSRLWANKERLADYLHTTFAQGLARGMSYDKLSRLLQERFVDRSSYETKRLVRTEATFALNESQRQVFMGLYGDGAAYIFSNITDGKACELCREIERETERNPVRCADAQPGVNYPPMHPNCRCTTRFALNSEEEFIDELRAELWGEQ